MRKNKIIKQLQDEICHLEVERERLHGEILWLKDENKSKKKKELVEALKDYQYAILVKGIDTEVWNDGRFEQGVREVNFTHIARSIPEIEITK